MFQILLKLKFCVIHLNQNQIVLVLVLLTLLFLKSEIRQYRRKLRDEFVLLILLSVLQAEALKIQDASASVAVVSRLLVVKFHFTYYSKETLRFHSH